MNSIKISFEPFGTTLTTRDLGKTIRETIESALNSGNNVAIDLTKIELMTSGFSDEVFGVLFEHFGIDGFRNNISFGFPAEEEKKKLLQALINRAINDRMKRQSSKLSH